MDQVDFEAACQCQIEKTVETVDGKPLSFESVMDLGFSLAVTAGTIDASGKMHLEVTQAGKTTQRVVDYPQGALMTEGLNLVWHSFRVVPMQMQSRDQTLKELECLISRAWELKSLRPRAKRY